ncbi:uncharacterized protein LOC142620267 [Castanea sativa]|uniref:uncharacterized protein LOC142620267 n=1 Tax=Castanea sativa TaxID=21020 RepID=UPI003F64E9AF
MLLQLSFIDQLFQMIPKCPAVLSSMAYILMGDPNRRPRDKYCRLHQDHGHDTADCYDLKQQIEALIRRGRLQRFVNKERADPPQNQAPRRDNDRPRQPVGDKRMIVGGTMIAGSSKKARKTYLRTVQNVQMTSPALERSRIDNPPIEFSEGNARRLHHPHDDTLVVTIWAGDYNIHRVLIDNGSSTDILYYPAFQQMGFGKERLVPTNASLVGFGGARVLPLGIVTLAVTIGDYPQQVTRNVSACECYVTMMEMDSHIQAMNIEERRVATEPIERLKDVLLDEAHPE